MPSAPQTAACQSELQGREAPRIVPCGLVRAVPLACPGADGRTAAEPSGAHRVTTFAPDRLV